MWKWPTHQPGNLASLTTECWLDLRYALVLGPGVVEARVGCARFKLAFPYA